MATGETPFNSLTLRKKYRIEFYGEDAGSGTFDRYQQR
jgi:hypothetical protein